MNRPPLFNTALLPTNPMNLPPQQQPSPLHQQPPTQQQPSSQQLNGKQSINQPLLPLPTTNPQLVNFSTGRPPPGQPPHNHPLLTKHNNTNLAPNRLPLVTNQPPPSAALLNRLPNPTQLLQNPPNAALLSAAVVPRPHHLLNNPSIKPPHLLQTPPPLIAAATSANPLIASNPLVLSPVVSLAQTNGIQSTTNSSAINEQSNKSPLLNDQSPSNDQPAECEEKTESSDQPIDSSEIWVETSSSDGKTYYYNAKTRETTWNKPTENCKKIITQQQFMHQQQQLAAAAAVQIKPNGDLVKQLENPFSHQLPFQHMPGVMPPFAHPQFPMHPQLMMPPSMMANLAVANQQKMMIIPPEIRIAAMEWMEYKTPEGKPYYFSNKTQQSVWDKPKALIDLEQAMNKLKNDQQNQQKASTNQNKEEKKVDKNKPVSSTPITNTPWCLVRTGDDRVFFFNPSTKTSVWQRPKDLENNEEVDRLLNGETPATGAKKDNETNKQQSKPAITTEQDESEQKMQTSKENNDGVMVSEESNSSSVNTDSNLNKDDNASTPTPVVNNKRSSIEDDKAAANKKQKVFSEEESRKQLGITSIEQIASKQREQIPLEERIEMFTKMLEEKEVSAFSTWEKELHKIVFDSRYLLLTSKERKQTFDKYTRERVEKERREKLNKTKKQRQEFRNFIKDKFKEHNYSVRMTYAEFAKKHSSSDQFKLIEKVRDREQMFHEFIDELKKKEREDKQREKDKAKENFLDLLKENQKLFDRHSHFSDLRERFRDDPRYKALQSSQKEDLFRSFVSNLPSSKHSSKRSHSKERHHHHHKESKSSSDRRSDRDRSSSKLKDKSLSLDKTKNEDSDDSNSRASKTKKKPTEEDLDEGELNPSSNESEADFKLEKDQGQTVNENDLTEEERKELEKMRRIERSLKEREKQVQKEMQGHLLEREKHRNMHKKQELVDNFNILLLDLIRNPDLSYREAKKVLKKDHRYEMFEGLSRGEKEDLFEAHINTRIKKKRKLFVELLEETKEIKLNSSWREIRRLIEEDPRYLQLPEKRCEKEFHYFLKEKLMKAKNDFKSLLKETKLITHKSRKLIETTDQQHLADILCHLQNDKRYLDLDLIEDERRQLIIDYIEHLAARGSPPPVTASTSNRK